MLRILIKGPENFRAGTPCEHCFHLGCFSPLLRPLFSTLWPAQGKWRRREMRSKRALLRTCSSSRARCSRAVEPAHMGRISLAISSRGASRATVLFHGQTRRASSFPSFTVGTSSVFFPVQTLGSRQKSCSFPLTSIILASTRGRFIRGRRTTRPASRPCWKRPKRSRHNARAEPLPLPPLTVKRRISSALSLSRAARMSPRQKSSRC